MNRKDIETIQSATLTSVNAQLVRTLTTMSIRGWVFPREYDVGVTVLASTPLVTKVKVRMDETVVEGAISSTSVAEDVAKICDDLAAAWLALKATGRPTKKQRSSGE